LDYTDLDEKFQYEYPEMYQTTTLILAPVIHNGHIKQWFQPVSCEDATLCGSPSPQYSAYLLYGWRRQPPDMEGNCNYIE